MCVAVGEFVADHRVGQTVLRRARRPIAEVVSLILDAAERVFNERDTSLPPPTRSPTRRRGAATNPPKSVDSLAYSDGRILLYCNTLTDHTDVTMNARTPGV